MRKLFQYITIFTFTLFVTITVETALGSTVILIMDNGIKGSGFFVEPDLIATSYRVIEGSSSGYAYAIYGKKNISIVGIAAADKYDDLVILKVAGDQGTPLSIGDSNLVKKGDTISISHPLKPVLKPVSIRTPTSIVTETKVREIRESRSAFDGSSTIDGFLISAPETLRGGEPILNDNRKVIGVFKRTDPNEDNVKQNIMNVVASKHLTSLMREYSHKFLRPLSADGVSGTHLTWGPDYYEFTLWNHRNETIYNPQCVIIFKDEKGEVICADQFLFDGMMFAGGGSRVSRNFFSNTDSENFSGYFYDPASKPYPPGDYFKVSLVGPSLKQIMHSYEIKIIDLAIDIRFPSQKKFLKGITGSGLTWFEMSKLSEVDGIGKFTFPGSSAYYKDSPKKVGFSYSVRNNLSTDITNVRLTLVFYDKEGVPIDQWEINNPVNILAKKNLKVKGRVSRSTKQLTKSVEPQIFHHPLVEVQYEQSGTRRKF